jgi:class 3 adenylate cyclase
MHVTLPVVGLVWLVVAPHIDRALFWDHRQSHFWLVLGTSVVSSLLALKATREARTHADARLFLVALSFLLASGFLGLHALGTPGVILEAPNAGFVLGTPIGLGLAALPALAAAFVPAAPGRALLRRSILVLALILVLLVVWAIWSLARLEPLDGQPAVEEHRATFGVVTVPATVAYLAAAVGLYVPYRRRPSVVLLAVLTAFVLLGEATMATLVGRNWQATWWSWHVLMTIAFMLVTYAVSVEYSREGSPRSLFRGVLLEETLARARRDYAAALEALVTAVESGRPESVQLLAADLAERFGLSDAQVDLLAHAADALGHERERIRRLGALVEIGREVSVIRPDTEVVARAREHLRTGFAPDDVTVELDPAAAAAWDRQRDDDRLAAPLVVKGRPAGLVTVTRRNGGSPVHDEALLGALASQLSIAVENARMYHELDRLFRQYLSPDVATALLADPAQAALGGEVREITVAFGDLHSFTTFSERHEPSEVVAMLNHYFGLAVPIFLGEGGTVTQFIGDAIMVMFNAPMRQDDHAARAVRAACAAATEIDAAAAAHGWPRMRIGVNTGPALVGNVGGDEVRLFTAIGDAVNLASRLEGLAPPGGVVIGARTRELLGDAVTVDSVGPVSVKGKEAPVDAYRVVGTGTLPGQTA